MPLSKHQLSHRVTEDYRQHVNRFILVTRLTIHVGDESLDVDFSRRPLLAKVLPGADPLYHCGEDWIDPQWPIRLVRPLPGNMEVRTVAAPAYSLSGRHTSGDVLPAPWWIRAARSIRRHFESKRRPAKLPAAT